MSDESDVFKELHGEDLTIHNAPELYKAMKGVAKDLQIAMPKFHLLPSEISILHRWRDDQCMKAWVKTPNAASVSHDEISITQPLLKLLESEDLTKPISAELKAVLAHEMYHCATIRRDMVITRLPLFALPLIAVIATFIYDRAHVKAKKETGNSSPSPQEIVKHLESATDETKKSLPPEVAHSSLFKNVLYYGKYFAAAAVGVGAGLFVTRYVSRSYEFAADLLATRHVADPEIMVSALRKLHKAEGMSISEDIHEAKKVIEVISEYIFALHAHPTFAERAAHVRGR